MLRLAQVVQQLAEPRSVVVFLAGGSIKPLVHGADGRIRHTHIDRELVEIDDLLVTSHVGARGDAAVAVQESRERLTERHQIPEHTLQVAAARAQLDDLATHIRHRSAQSHRKVGRVLTQEQIPQGEKTFQGGNLLRHGKGGPHECAAGIACAALCVAEHVL